MPSKPTHTESTSTPKNAMIGQIVACTVALGIMGLGAWSLLGQKAPYHPDGYDPEVTRATSDLTGVPESD